MATESDNRTWRCKDREFDLSRRTYIVGILNLTPDSFSDGGRYMQIDKAVERALEIEAEGADVIDIGGESTRPGSQAVTAEEEMRRVIPLIEQLSGKLQIPISIDTYKASVAERSLAAGAVIVNDISGLRFDHDMASVVAKSGAGVVIMHIKGTPRDMQKNPHYDDLMAEIGEYLNQSKQIALSAGMDHQRIAVDPGIGFGKRLQDNFQIIRELSLLTNLKSPLLVGPSRKSFIGAVLDLPVEQRLEGTAAAVAACILNGADILRVHDVKEMKRVALITDAVIGKGNSG